MDRAENCFFCGSNTPEADLVAWFVDDERRVTHTECWLQARRSKQSSDSGRAAPDAEVTIPHQALRKTLDDIRRELEAEYPSSPSDEHQDEPDVPPVHVPMPPYLNGDQRAADRRRTASRRHARRRHAVAVTVGCVAVPLLLIGAFFWATWDIMWPGAITTSAPDVPPSGATVAVPAAPVSTHVAAPVVETRVVEARPEPPVVVAPPAVSPAIEAELKALRKELAAIAAKLERSESHMVGVEARVRGVESSVRRLGDEITTAAARRRTERAPSPPARAARAEAPAPPPPTPAPPPPTPSAVTAEYAERWIPSEPAHPGSPRRRAIRPLAEEIAPPPPRATPPRPRRESTNSPEDGAPTTDAVPSATASAPSEAASPSTTPATLRDKVRDDWRTIKRGFASAGEELKETVSGLVRKVKGN